MTINPNTAAPADDFTHEVTDLVRTSNKAELELADIGTRMRATFKRLGITDKAGAFAALSGQYQEREEGVLFQPMKAGLVLAYVHEDDVNIFHDKNKDGKAELRSYNFRTGKYSKVPKSKVTTAVGAASGKLRNRIIANAFDKKKGEKTDADVSRVYELLETSRKLKNMNTPTGRGADEDAIERIGGYDVAVAMIAAIDAIVAMAPASVIRKAKAKQPTN